jgi:predicted Zn-dependent protease
VKRHLGFILAAALLVLGGGLTALGPMDAAADLNSVLTAWKEALWDVDRAGLELARVSSKEEEDLGGRLAAALPPQIPADPRLAAYVVRVGGRLTPFARRKDIQWRFTVVDEPYLNAFALPGGRVYIYRGLIDALNDEAELAAILGHEMAHVDLRHAVGCYQYEILTRRIGLGDAGALADLLRRVAEAGYQSGQEAEADADGFVYAAKAGYDPSGAARAFQVLMRASRQPAGPVGRASSPLEEANQAVWRALADAFRSHPPTPERERAMIALMEQNRSALEGRRFCVGRANLQQRATCGDVFLEAEWFTAGADAATRSPRPAGSAPTETH